jgi:hypothetical protein
VDSSSRIAARVPLDGCVVCAYRDERGLTTVMLASGIRVAVCGSHDLVYRRSGQVAYTVDELCSITRERRERAPRRDEGDDLGQALSAAFAPARRSGSDRRR